jgi:hypothetical protein
MNDDSDIGDDGALSLDDTPNLDSPTLDLPSTIDDTDGESIDDIAPLDNVNGSSNIANPQPSLTSQFAAGLGVESVLDSLTGGAGGLADDLAGLIAPDVANDTTTPSTITTPLLVGGGVILAFLFLK